MKKTLQVDLETVDELILGKYDMAQERINSLLLEVEFYKQQWELAEKEVERLERRVLILENG